MVKHISLINRHKHESFEDFRTYWMEVHSQIVKGVLPKLRKYVANFPADIGSSKAPGSGQYLQCDAIIELHFDTLEDLNAAMTSEGWLSERRRSSSARLMDLERNLFMVADEIVIDLPG